MKILKLSIMIVYTSPSDTFIIRGKFFVLKCQLIIHEMYYPYGVRGKKVIVNKLFHDGTNQRNELMTVLEECL